MQLCVKTFTIVIQTAKKCKTYLKVLHFFLFCTMKVHGKSLFRGFCHKSYNQNSAEPVVRGNGSTSRMFAMPVRYITMRSKPRPKPACLLLPKRRRSRYHQ